MSTHYSLFATHALLLTTHYLPLMPCYSLLTICHSCLATHYSLLYQVYRYCLNLNFREEYRIYDDIFALLHTGVQIAPGGRP